MKRYATYLALLLCFGLMFVLAGCGSTDTATNDTATTNDENIQAEADQPEDLLVGTWQLNEDTSTTTLTIAADGSYTEDEVIDSSENSVEGKYTVSDDEITLVTDKVNDKTKDEYTEQELEENKRISDLFEDRTFAYRLEEDDSTLVLTTSPGQEYSYTRIDNTVN